MYIPPTPTNVIPLQISMIRLLPVKMCTNKDFKENKILHIEHTIFIDFFVIN